MAQELGRVSNDDLNLNGIQLFFMLSELQYVNIIVKVISNRFV